MTGEFERTVDFLGDAFSNIETTHKFLRFKTCDDEVDIEADNNGTEGGPVTVNFNIDVFFLLIKKYPQPK